MALVLFSSISVLGIGASFAEEECGTRLTPEGAAVNSYLQSAGAYDPVDSRYTLVVTMSFHVVRQSNGAGGITTSQLNQGLIDVNTAYRPLGVEFVLGQTDFIDSDDYYYNIDTQEEIDQLRLENRIADTVNVYFTEYIVVDGIRICGQTSFSWNTSQGVVMSNGCTGLSSKPASFPHEVGHYLDLFHPHETIFGIECPDGLNCGSAGDQLCDTPADPGLGSSNVTDPPGCTYFETETACGQSYNPDVTNLMSYAPQPCRSLFSPHQQEKAISTLVNLRGSLIGGQASSVTWVDFAHLGPHNGTYSNPFNTVATAVVGTSPGGRIVFKPGSSPETATINSSITLDSFRGVAVIGE